MPALVTIEQARRHLRLTVDDMDTDTAADVATKSETASEIVIDYIKRPAHGWTADTVPGVVRAAILLTLAALFEDRETATVSEPVKNLLHRFRDPALA